MQGIAVSGGSMGALYMIGEFAKSPFGQSLARWVFENHEMIEHTIMPSVASIGSFLV
jgi:hypothetical protein